MSRGSLVLRGTLVTKMNRILTASPKQTWIKVLLPAQWAPFTSSSHRQQSSLRRILRPGKASKIKIGKVVAWEENPISSLNKRWDSTQGIGTQSTKSLNIIADRGRVLALASTTTNTTAATSHTSKTRCRCSTTQNSITPAAPSTSTKHPN